jgi:hypothetical protein
VRQTEPADDARVQERNDVRRPITNELLFVCISLEEAIALDRALERRARAPKQQLPYDYAGTDRVQQAIEDELH